MTTGDEDRTSEIRAAVLFECVREMVVRFVSLGDYEAIVIALWIMMTHVIEAFDCVPYLWIHSAEKQCGKTRLLEVLDLLVARSWLTGRTTPAVLARKINAEHPTLLLDESDATVRGDKEYGQALRGVLDSGYLRSGKTSACVTKGRTIEFADFSTFGPKAIAGIGSLWDTVVDRSIPIRLTRKLAIDKVERFLRRHVCPEAKALYEEIETWEKAFVAGEYSEPYGLDSLPDRAADICEPLLIIAEACGAEVATSARAALVALCGREREDDSLGVRALADIRTVLNDEGSDRIASSALALRLAAIEESPWGPRFGRDFDARELAKLLKPFGIRPHSIRADDDRTKTPKGYYRHDFDDAWARYLPSSEKPPQAPQPPQANKIRGFSSAATDAMAKHDLAEPPLTAGDRDDRVAASVPPQAVEPQPEKLHELRLVADVADVAVPRDGEGRTLTLPFDDVVEEL